MRKLGILLAVALALLFGGFGQAKASLITSLPGGTVVPMPLLEYFGPGPQVFGPGITWSSTNTSNQGGSVFGYTQGYGFSGNGYWDGILGPMAGLNDSTDAYGPPPDTMTFAFSTPQSAVGGFINYVPNGSTPTTIAVYDSGYNLIESFDLTFLTGGGTNTGQFLGFQEATANISYFTLTDNYIGLTNLTILAAVPEPGTLTLVGIGAFGLAMYGRRRRVKVAV